MPIDVRQPTRLILPEMYRPSSCATPSKKVGLPPTRKLIAPLKPEALNGIAIDKDIGDRYHQLALGDKNTNHVGSINNSRNMPYVFRDSRHNPFTPENAGEGIACGRAPRYRPDLKKSEVHKYLYGNEKAVQEFIIIKKENFLDSLHDFFNWLDSNLYGFDYQKSGSNEDRNKEDKIRSVFKKTTFVVRSLLKSPKPDNYRTKNQYELVQALFMSYTIAKKYFPRDEDVRNGYAESLLKRIIEGDCNFRSPRPNRLLKIGIDQLFHKIFILIANLGSSLVWDSKQQSFIVNMGELPSELLLQQIEVLLDFVGEAKIASKTISVNYLIFSGLNEMEEGECRYRIERRSRAVAYWIKERWVHDNIKIKYLRTLTENIVLDPLAVWIYEKEIEDPFDGDDKLADEVNKKFPRVLLRNKNLEKRIQEYIISVVRKKEEGEEIQENEEAVSPQYPRGEADLINKGIAETQLTVIPPLEDIIKEIPPRIRSVLARYLELFDTDNDEISIPNLHSDPNWSIPSGKKGPTQP